MGRIVDGVIYCRVERVSVTTVNGVNFNLIDDKHFLLLASGSSFQQNTINGHDIDFEASSEAYLLSEVSVVEARSRIMLYLHASFMIVAWIGTTSIGIFSARFMKQTWIKAKPFGKDFWFLIHTTAMFLTWLLTLAAFIIIFIDSARWTTNPHSVLGTIAFSLCMIQPIGAAFRPAPKSAKRPIFNFLHMAAGNLAHLCASEYF